MPNPRYVQIATTLAEEIRNGAPAVGANLPGEVELCRRFGTSRHTLRHALSLLEERGLILRRQGASTCVVARESPKTFVQSLNSITELLRYPSNTYRQNVAVDTITVSSDQVAILNAPEGSNWLRISAVRRERGSRTAVAWTDIYVAPQYAGVVQRKQHTESMVFEQIEKHYGVAIDRAEVQIFADSLQGNYARHLQLPRGTPSLTIVRRYYDRRGDLFEVTVTQHPEKRFVFTMEINRNVRN